ncbi:hypothetical protein [Desulfogranum marinum]|uniref:hypothetical protein n=1 Tax=Desulfogranum marinum TaxID=453220 RepID=UPI001966CCBB|nr:hypothetical protein [Desulfogranum marinum]MBM9512314.1 hypothetical protein [Desulfogranum marinum]
MNKRIGIILVVVAVVAAAGFYVLNVSKKEDAGSYAAFLPQDTLATVSLTHLNKISDTFADSPLGHLLAKETMGGILNELQVDGQAVATYDKTYDDMVALMNNPAFLSVFGDDTALAVLSPDLARLKGEPQREIERSMVVFATTAVSGALDSFAKLIMSDTVTTEVIDNLTLTKIEVSDGEIIYGVAAKGTVLLSYAPQTILACLTAAESEVTLENAASFLAAKQYWQSIEAETVYSRMFVNSDALMSLLARAEEDEISSIAKYLEGITYFSSLTYQLGQDLHSDSRAGFEPGKLHPALQAALEQQVEANTSLNLLNENTLIYDWSSSLSAEVMLHSFAAGDEQELDQFETVIQQELGLSFAQLLQAIGPQYGFVVNQIVNSGFFPLPKVVAFVEVRDSTQATAVFNTIREKINQTGFAEEKTVEANGQTVYYWSVLPGEATQLAMVLTPTMLYAANGKSVLVDLLNQGGALTMIGAPVAASLGDALKNQVEAAGLGTFIVYPARLANELQDVAGWLVSTLAATQGVSASRLGEEIINLMLAYEVVAMTTKLTPEHGDWHCTIKSKQPVAATEN